ncbi:hypothetical protein [Alistipes shahii]|uniref:hypothetical protein n=1 Tax=Alistipes shahii TaxID=328814 RepID=UPI003F7BD520
MAREVIFKFSLDDSWDDYDTINTDLFIEDLFPVEHLKDGVIAIRVLKFVDSAQFDGKDEAYRIIDRDAIKMNNGDTMVDVSTAYMAIDFARDDERGKTADVLNSWKTVEDILPHELEQVLVKNDEQECYDVGYILQGKWYSKVGKVTHWKRFAL